MGDAGSEGLNFLGMNVLVIGAVLLLIFGYLILLIRKRWREGFLHPPEDPKHRS